MSSDRFAIRADGMLCGSCAASNPPHANFCNACGARIAPVDFVDGERRHVTALFCDMVSSTEIAARLDPEHWHEIATHYRQAASGEIVKLGGHVHQYLGDGLIAYFGYPEAREDACERAVRAGLAIVSAMAALNARYAAIHKVALAVRIGLHSGSVVVARGGDSEVGMFGDTPNIAARVQEAAKPDTVVMTAIIRAAIADRFAVEDLGPYAFKGLEKPIQLFRAVEALARPSGVYRRGLRTRTTFVGRTEEVGALLERHRRAREGEGQLVLITGEPGIGKSRLVEEFRAEIGNSSHLWLGCGGEPLLSSTPFHPVMQLLGLGSRGETRKKARARLLRRALQTAKPGIDGGLALVTEMLDPLVPGDLEPPAFAGEQKRAQLLAALTDWLLSLARREQLIVIAIEDLHWVDPSTLELLRTLTERAAAVRVLIIATTRPEFRPPWPMRAHHAQITLSRLDRKQTRAILEGAVSPGAIDRGLLDSLAERAEGVPLFAEELVQSVMASGNQHEIPATLRDSLTARLDRLGDAKETAQLGAVIGREFTYDLLRAISALTPDDLHAALAKLSEADLLYASAPPPAASFKFKHALVRDAAYEGLLRSQRRVLHGRVGRAITENFSAFAETHPEVLAHHWSEAEEHGQATEAWSLAARERAARHAYKEAAEAITRSRAALTALPESVDRDARELQLCRWLVGVSQIAYGYSADETQQATQMARRLAEKTGDLRKQFAYIAGEWMAASSAGDYQASATLAAQLLPLAQKRDVPDALAAAYMILTTTRCRSGDLKGAEEAFRAGEPLFATAEYTRRAGAAAQAFGNGAVNAWVIGDVSEARRRIQPVLHLARAGEDPYELAFSQYMAAMVLSMLGDLENAEQLARQSIAHSADGRFPQFAATSAIVLGHVRAEQSHAPEGISLMQDGLRAMEGTRSRAGLTMYLTWLAAGQAGCGRSSESIETLNRALSINPQELFFRPETLRLRGERYAEIGDKVRAVADFRAAVDLARTMEAKSFLSRATANLEAAEKKTA